MAASIPLPPGKVIQPSLVPGADRGESEQAATAAPQRGSGYRLPQRDAACLANSVRERRRMNRIAEQKRRDALKHSLLDLRALIPAPAPVHDAEGSSGGGTPGQLHTKSAVIRQTIEYIQHLHGRHREVRRQRESLVQANDALRKCIEEAMQAKRQDNAGGEQRSGGGGHYGDVDRMLGVLD